MKKYFANKKIKRNALIIFFLFCIYRYAIWNPDPIVYIPKDAVTMKQILPYANKYMHDNGSKKPFYLEKIFITLDKDGRSDIEFFYIVKTKKVQISYIVLIDPTEHAITKVYKPDYSSDDFEIDINSWKIDSDEAIDIATKLAKEKFIDFNPNYISLRADRTEDGVFLYVNAFSDIIGDKNNASQKISITFNPITRGIQSQEILIE